MAPTQNAFPPAWLVEIQVADLPAGARITHALLVPGQPRRLRLVVEGPAPAAANGYATGDRPVMAGS